MYLQVVYCLKNSSQNQAAILKVKAKPSCDYFQIEKEVKPKLTEVLGHCDYDIFYMNEITKKEFYQLAEEHYIP